MDNVRIAAPPRPCTPFTSAYHDRHNQGVPFRLDAAGHHPVTYHMHIDDNLFAAVGIPGIWWAMHCSIAGLIGILGDNESALQSKQPDMEKFLKDEVGFQWWQLGLIINTCTLDITIPEDKHEEIIILLHEWIAKSHFYLRQATELL